MSLWLTSVGIGPPRTIRLDDRPCPCVIAHGIAGAFQNQWWIEEADHNPTAGLAEPEIRAIANSVSRQGRRDRAA